LTRSGIALWDITGQAKNDPICCRLSGTRANPLRTYLTDFHLEGSRANGLVPISDGAGIGLKIEWQRVAKYTQRD
jgi:L-alanine-DL-glutamate epimerase-like enolase superfamily enzyme